MGRDLAGGDFPSERADRPLFLSRLERCHTAAGTVTVPR